ncbi:MAG TPA: hypothetical protein V6D15_13350 [Oculatellaceae cyanobacterium]|jgi:hypothetical protein
MSCLDDASLIHKFILGEGELLSNPHLRVESAFDMVQLIAKKGGVVAVIKQNCEIASVLVNLSSPYLRLIHSVLLKHSFVPLGQLENKVFLKYEYHEIPAGYQINYTSTKTLWSKWYTQTYRSRKQAIELDILVLIRSAWYPIKNISYTPGEFFIETLAGESHLHNEDRVVWLNKIQVKPLQETLQPSPTQLPPSQELTPENVSTQLQLALAIRPLALQAFYKCVELQLTQEVKLGYYIVKLSNYKLAYQPNSESLFIADTSRGVVAKYRGEQVETATNLEVQDVNSWQAILVKLKSLDSQSLHLKN